VCFETNHLANGVPDLSIAQVEFHSQLKAPAQELSELGQDAFERI
jgi:hypothetical protein